METEYDSVNAALYSEHVKYDQACKRVLAEKRFLARILKRCVEEYKDSTFDEIAGYIEGTPEIGETQMRPDNPRITGADTEDGSIFEQTIRYDVKFNAAVPGSDDGIGLIINLEAQKKYDTGYPLVKRGVYYCCRLISSQYGREFTKSHYGKLKKVLFDLALHGRAEIEAEYDHRVRNIRKACRRELLRAPRALRYAENRDGLSRRGSTGRNSSGVRR